MKKSCFFYAVFLIFTLLMNDISFAEELVGEEPIIYADSAIVMDIKTGTILYGKNIDKKQYPASITKIMTALLAIENKNLSETITFSDTAIKAIPRDTSHLWMVPGEQITLEQGLYGLLLKSANDISTGIAELTDGSIENFAKHMTQRAKKLGAQNTNFANPNGLHDDNHYITAHDMALIAREAIKNETFKKIVTTRQYTIPKTNKNEERYLFNSHKMMHKNTQHYYTYCEGGKTGWTSVAQHTLVTFAKKDNMELVTVVLRDDAPNLYLDTTKLMDYGFNNFKLVDVISKTNSQKEISVIKSKNQNIKSIYAIPQESYSYVLPKQIPNSNIIIKTTFPVQINNSVITTDIIAKSDIFYNNALIKTVEYQPNQSVEIPSSLTHKVLSFLIAAFLIICKVILYTFLFLLAFRTVVIFIRKYILKNYKTIKPKTKDLEI